MVISDKQTLRRCVKQAVRRAAVVETLLNFDTARGEMGIKALTTSISKAQGLTPLQADAAAAFAATTAWCRNAVYPAQSPIPAIISAARRFAGGARGGSTGQAGSRPARHCLRLPASIRSA